MSELTKETGKRIHDFRKSRGLNQEELARLIYKSKATLSKYEKGEIAIDLDTLKQLALALHVRMEQLLPPTVEGYEEPEQHGIPTFSRASASFTATGLTVGTISSRAASLIFTRPFLPTASKWPSI